MQLNRYVALSGVSSRRMAVEYIKSGLVTVNNLVMREPGYRVVPCDSVRFQGTMIKPVEQPLYVLVHKPLGFVTTCNDESGRPTVLDCCPSLTRRLRLYPVGRLDMDSRGLVLLTNDGTISERLVHPRYGVEKRYRVKIDKPLSPEFIEQLRRGIMLQDGLARLDKLFVDRDARRCEIVLHSGRNRIIRRLMSAGGYHVVDLARVGFGPLTVRGLAVGAWRMATGAEIAQLQRLSKRTAESGCCQECPADGQSE